MKHQGGSYVLVFFATLALAGGVYLALLPDSPVRVYQVWGAFTVTALVAIASAVFRHAAARRSLDASADINELAYHIRSNFGRDAQAEFLSAVSELSEPGKNSNMRRFAPGHDRRTIRAMAADIAARYPPVCPPRDKAD